MTNPPPSDPRKPPVLGYSTPRPSLRNTPGRFIARAAVGLGIGIAGCVGGGFLAAYSNYEILFFVPITLALVGAIVYAVTQRKYGFVTGIILAPFFLAVGIVLLLLIICGTAIIGI
jgi:hypothetical protein